MMKFAKGILFFPLLISQVLAGALLRRSQNNHRGLQVDECVDCCTTIGGLVLKDIVTCDHHHVRLAISNAIGNTCPHNRDVEAQKLTGKTTTNEALDALVVTCKAQIQSCTTVEDLDLENIRECHIHWIKEEIRKKQEGCSATRADWQEAIVLSGKADWDEAQAFLLQACWQRLTPCVKLSDLEEDFKDVRDCGSGPVQNVLQERLVGTCTRPRDREAIAIVWDLEREVDPNSVVVWNDDKEDTIDAHDYLMEKCQGKITPCLENTDALFDSFSSVTLCDSHRVRMAIAALHGDTCPRSPDYDAVLISPQEYPVWRDNKDETLNAEDYMIEECTKRITPCASLDELLKLFPSIRSCHQHYIRQDIESLQGEECTRSSEWDGVLLAKELMLRENSDETEFPPHWYNNDPSVLTASKVLEAKCQSLIKPCTTKENLYLGFETVQYCDQHRVIREIQSHLGDDCRRNAYDDSLLITPAEYTVWGDDKEETKDARVHLMNQCSIRAKPSFSLFQLEADFVDIDRCGWGSIHKAIEVRQSAIDSTRRKGEQDAIFLAGEILKAQDDSVLITTELGLAGELQLENPDANYAVMSFGNNDGTYNVRKLLRDRCEDIITGCIGNMEQFDEALKDIYACHDGYILKLIEAHQKEGCARATHYDAPLLARDYELSANPGIEPPTFVWGGNVPELNSALYLNEKCLSKIETCVPSLDLIDFSTVANCNHHHIRNLIRDNQKDECNRSPEEDARLIVRDLEWAQNSGGPRPALRNWWDEDPNTMNAAEYLVEMCHSTAKSCVPSYDELNFEDIDQCNDHLIRLEITNKQPDTCSRHPNFDGPILIREKLRQENPDDGYEPPPYVWRDNNPETNDAYDYLMDDCKRRITPCSSVDDMDFENIQFCSEHWIRAEIIAKQEGCSSERHAHYDAMIMTGADTWRDDSPDTSDAIQILTETCEEEIKPCVTLDTLDFRYIRNCDGHHIRLLIDETRENMGSSCPSYGKRSVIEEAILITGADVYRDDKEETTDAEGLLIDQCMAQVESCTLKSGESLDVKGCDWISFKNAVKQGTREDDCRRQLDFELYALDRELKALTGSSAEELVSSSCSSAWSAVNTSTFDQIDSEFTNSFMDEYVDGLTHLNKNTGNFQGNCVDDRDGEIGTNIADFRMYQAEETLMQGFDTLESCDSQAIMCCFGRDRQFGDNNGNCKIEDRGGCEDADPADNSNLCKTETRAYPNNDPPENEIHCHGLAWGLDENELTRKLKFNNFFFVSLFDHMYQRGYVERTIRREDDPSNFRMCDCIEKMPPVSRSDCTEVTINPFSVSREADGSIEATPPDSLDVQFNACRGDGRNNDLSAYIKRLVREGRFSEAMQSQAFDTLVGYENPNDNDNEAACQAIL